MTEVTEDVLFDEEDTQKGRFLAFCMGNEEYGIEISYVTEIIGIQAITQVPELPDHIKGIINLRGKIIPVMDVRLRFKKEPKEYNDKTCIIVVDIKEVSIGLIVDTVAEVLSISEDNLVEPPQLTTGSQNKYIKAIGKIRNEVKLILDCDRLLNDDQIQSIAHIS
ncbi:MAG: chemotaxis protein CheW [Firmicutes bacterium HGW-Firmicutes-1]|jgi:purine-binding chemotaxis protein CheW|nr:MAG: chemotaxis protein CheW [Firmicutes bacterium HGW-Firmicutes-1]